MDELKKAEIRFCEAAGTDDFQEILAAAAEYRDAFDEKWRNMSLGQRRRSRMPDEAARLLRWAISLVRMTRSAVAERRRGSSAAGRYLVTGRDKPFRTWGSAG